MIIANIRINLSSAEALSCASIPKNAVGLKVRFQYADPLWNKFSKTAVFRNGTRTVNSILVDDCAAIPHELLGKTKDTIYVGLYGTDSNRALAIPTVWAKLGEVSSSATPSSHVSSEATLPYWAQIQEKVDSLEQEMMDQEDLNRALEQAKGSGTFDGPQGPKGAQGDRGEAGPAGYTPVVGVDYWTNEDKQAISTEAANIAASVIQHSSDIICASSWTHIELNDSSNRELHGLKLYGKTTQNGTPTPESPVPLESVGADGNVSVTVCGKNILPNRYASGSLNGVKFDVNSDGSYHVHGTATAQAQFAFSTTSYKTYDFTKTMVLSGGAPNVRIMFWVYNKDGKYIAGLNSESKSIKVTQPNGAKALCVIEIPSGVTVDTVVYPQLEYGSTATAYEPYKTEQTLTASTPNGLPGIPVTSGGNYTDENGQQWICDEVDFEKGVYVQRVLQQRMMNLTSYGISDVTGLFIGCSENLRSKCIVNVGMSNALPLMSANEQWNYSMGCFAVNKTYGPIIQIENCKTVGALNTYLAEHEVIVQVALQEHSEHALSAEQLAAFASLHSNYPNTTVFNDKDAGMEVKYVADTKMYIDNKFAELATAILNA